MKSLLYIFLAVIACSCNTSKSDKTAEQSASVSPSPQWVLVHSSDSSTAEARHEAAFININEKMYLLGGRGIKHVDIYDAEQNTWSKGAQSPIELHHFQAVIYDEKIYVIGAFTGKYPGESPVPNIYIYDPALDEWLLGDEIPEARRRGSAGIVVYENKIYMVAGIKDGHIGDHKDWLDVYDPSAGTWDTLAPAPRARDHFQAAVAKNKLYVVAGRQSKAPKETWRHTIAEVDVYDFATDTWSTLKNDLPTLRAGNMAACYHDDIVVIGGESAGQKVAHNEVEVLNTVTNEWSTWTPLLQGRHGSGLGIYKDEIYVVAGSGGKGGSPELNTLEKMSK